jgi:CHAT domain-containing protein
VENDYGVSRGFEDDLPEVPPVENDGILTAEDVSTLDLQGTWLVTLSACDTGSAEARAGEGIMGLRRGFNRS